MFFNKVYTDYGTPKESIITIDKMWEKTVEAGYKAAAITDHTMYAIQKAYDEIPRDENGEKKCKLIAGLQIFCDNDLSDIQMPLEFTVYACDYDGYLTISRLETESQKHIFERNKFQYPCVDHEIMERLLKNNKHVLVLSGGAQGLIIGGAMRKQAEHGFAEKNLSEVAFYEGKIRSIKDAEERINSLETERTNMMALSKKVKLNGEVSVDAVNAKEQAKALKLQIAVIQDDVKSAKAEVAKYLGLYTYEDGDAESLLSEKKAKFQATFDKTSGNLDLKECFKDEMMFYKNMLGHSFLIEVQGMTNLDKRYMQTVCELADELHIPIIASNSAYMPEKLDLTTKKMINAMVANKWVNEIAGEEEGYLKNEVELRDTLRKAVSDVYVEKAIKNMDVIEKHCTFDVKKEKYYPAYPCTEFNENTEEEFGNVLMEAPFLLKKQDKEGKVMPYTKADMLLTIKCYNGSKERYGKMDEEHRKRMEYELSTIMSMQFSDYFLIVCDFFNDIGEKCGHMPEKKLNYLREHYKEMTLEEEVKFINEDQSMPGLTTGFGRGSAAGSIVAYCTGITSIEPIRYNLLFERFLNPERVSMPDVDSDMSKANYRYGVRDIVIDYCCKKYGYNGLCGIATPSTLAARAAVKTMARIYGVWKTGNNMEYAGIAEAMNRIIPDKPGVVLKDYEEEIKEKFKGHSLEKEALAILDFAKKTEGLNVNFGRHACGNIIVGNRDVGAYAPLMMDPTTNQWKIEMDAETAETRGFLKMDYLGLKTLNIITDAARRVYDTYGKYLDLKNLPQDPEVYDHVFAKGYTNSVFQFESNGMKDMLRQFGKKTAKSHDSMTFEDIVLLVACYRPGPMQYLSGIIARRQHTLPDDAVIRVVARKNKNFDNLMKDTGYKFLHFSQLLKAFGILCNEKDKDKAKEYYDAAKTGSFDVFLDRMMKVNGIDEQTARDIATLMGSENAVTLIAKYKEEFRAIVEPTYLATVYQEQVMSIARTLAGYTMGGADVLRRAMGHKKMDVLLAERPKFVDGAVQHGVDKMDAEALFDEMIDFAKYAFNKSHAAAYAMTAYCTAYMKYHYPTEFYASVLNYVELKKYPALIDEATHFNVEVKAPDINKSGAEFTGKNNVVYFGFSGIKGIGTAAAQCLREQNVTYTSFTDFVLHSPSTKSMTKSLIEAGAFDCITENRSAIVSVLDEYYKAKDKITKVEKDITKYNEMLKDLENGVKLDRDKYKITTKTLPTKAKIIEKLDNLKNSLSENTRIITSEILIPTNIVENKKHKLEQERNLLGLYVTMSPVDLYKAPENVTITHIADLYESMLPVNILGIVRDLRVVKRKTDGAALAFFNLEDKSGTIACCLFVKKYKMFGQLVKEDKVLCLNGRVQIDQSSLRENENDDEDEVMDQKLQFVINSVMEAEEEKTSYIMYCSSEEEMETAKADIRERYGVEKGGHALYFMTNLQFDKVNAGFQVTDEFIRSGYEVKEV